MINRQDLSENIKNISTIIEKYLFPALLLNAHGDILYKNKSFKEKLETNQIYFKENILTAYKENSPKEEALKELTLIQNLLAMPFNIKINNIKVQVIINPYSFNTETNLYIAFIHFVDVVSITDTLIDNVPAQIFWKDANLIYQGCNQNFVKSLNLKSKNDVIGKSDFDLPVDKADSEKFRKDDRQVILSKKSKLNIEERQILENGEIKHLLTSKVPIFDKDNMVTGILAVYTDITKLKNTESELKIAKQRAEAADRAKAEFIANMSHDIRTPLTGIIGLSSMVESESHEEEIKEYAHMLNISGEQLLSLLNSVLDIVASDTIGKKALRYSVFSLEDLLHSIFELELPSLELKSIDFKLDMDKSLPKFVESDKEKIYRIILNILSNAIKFTHNGSITIKASLVEQRENNVLTKIQIIDTGIGIPKEDISKVFDQFYRASPAHEGKFDGYGVGLHIVQKYLKLLKGQVLVESEVGKGTCISLTLPLKKANKPDEYIKRESITTNNKPAPKPQNSPIEKSGHIENPKAHVLLVEDDLMARTVAKTMLSKEQCSVIEATNSTDAYELFIKNDVDFVLTDIGLPDFSGLELAKKMRQFEYREGRQQTPIIALSGHEDTDNLPVYEFKYGLSDMYTKPLRTEELTKILNDFGNKTKSPETINHQLLDEALAVRQLGSIEVVRDMAQMMLDDAFVNILPNIDKHFHAQEWELFKKQVHKFKSSCLYCATLPLLEIVQKLESLADSKNLDDIAPVYDQFLSCSEQTRLYIKSWLGK